MKFLKLYLFLFILFIPFLAKAQIINSYAKITNVSGATLTISGVAAEVNETAGAFAAGERVIVMQMQDNVIGTTADVAGFGNVGTIASAGLYEVSTITARTGTSITLATLANTFNVGANSSLQLISFPTFCTRGATTGLPWNGNIGGVIAFQCAGTMTLNGTINGNGIGFRGGDVSDFRLGTGGCAITPFISNSNTHGEKGESIYRISNNDYRYALGKIINGGGGGITTTVVVVVVETSLLEDKEEMVGIIRQQVVHQVQEVMEANYSLVISTSTEPSWEEEEEEQSKIIISELLE